MMTKNTFYLLLALFAGLISSQAFSQQQPYQYKVEVKYKLTFQPDSTDKSSIKSEFMTLLIGDTQSMYCATQFLVMDSAITAELVKGNTFGPSMDFFMQHGTKNSLVVFKDSSKIIAYERANKVDHIFFGYTEPKQQFGWTVLADTMSIGGIPCQKASTYFGNRKWYAWFAPSIPINEGPYKFNGLPGLILKINDSQEYWNFDLASIKNINTTLKIDFLNKKPQLLKNKEAFLSRKKNGRDNRFQLEKLKGGYTYSDAAAVRKMYEDDARKDNNWIELYNGK